MFSSNDGADFWAIVKAFADIGGYRLEWQLLNTAWFLPQNRERIYLIGHLAEGSTRNIFPVGEDGKICNRHREIKKKIHPNNNAITQCSRQYSNWCGDFIQVADYRIDEGLRLRGNNISPTLTSSKTGENISSSPPLIVASNAVEVKMIQNSGDIGNRKLSESNIAYSLRCSQGSDGGQSLVSNNSIRRLTEIECERLQGFPDNWTQYGDYDEVKKVSKTQRYKCLGNAITVNVVREIGRRIYDRI